MTTLLILGILFSPILAAVGPVPFMVKIFFWVALFLWALGGWFWSENPKFVNGGKILLIFLFGVLGWAALGFN